MPLCEKCGVVYEESSGDCPLCRQVRSESSQDAELEKTGRSHHGKVLIFAAVSASLITFITDFAFSGSITWSSIPLLSLAYITIASLSLSMFRRLPFFAALAVTASTTGFLYFLSDFLESGSDWFVSIALPLIAAILLLFILFIVVFRKLRLSFSATITVLLAEAGLLLISIDAIISSELSWSLVTTVGIACLMAFLIGLGRRLRARGSNLRKYFHT